MSLPVRCFTCNKVIGQFEERYNKMLESGINPYDALNTFGLSKYCCRRMFLGYVNIIDQLLLYPNDIEKGYEKKIEKTGKTN